MGHTSRGVCTMALKEFFAAVFGSWVEAVGVILTLLPFIEKVPRVKAWLHDKPFLERYAWLLWVVGGLCIIYGFYNAWYQQREKRIDAEAKLEQMKIDNTPILTGEITFSGAAPAGPNNKDCLVIVGAKIIDRGAPSIADDFSVTIKRGERTIVAKRLPLPMSGPITFGSTIGAPAVVFPTSDFLPNKGPSQGVSKERALLGFMHVLVPDLTRDEFQSNQTVVVLSYKDFTGKGYSIERRNVGRAEQIPDLNQLQKDYHPQ
jgi:hypothetical protein